MGLKTKKGLVVRDGVETDIPIEGVVKSDLVVVRPGEKIPMDGVVVFGIGPLTFTVFAGSLFSTIDDIDSNDPHTVMRISTVRSTSNDDLLGFRDIEASRTQSSIIPVFLNSPLMPGITSYMDPPQIALHHPNGCPRIFPDQWLSLQD